MSIATAVATTFPETRATAMKEETSQTWRLPHPEQSRLRGKACCAPIVTAFSCRALSCRDPNSDALGIVQFRDYYCFATFKVHSLSGLHLLVFKFFTTIRACHVV